MVTCKRMKSKTVLKANLIRVKAERKYSFGVETFHVTKIGYSKLSFDDSSSNPKKYGFVHTYTKEGVYIGLERLYRVVKVRAYFKSGKYSKKKIIGLGLCVAGNTSLYGMTRTKSNILGNNTFDSLVKKKYEKNWFKRFLQRWKK